MPCLTTADCCDMKCNKEMFLSGIMTYESPMAVTFTVLFKWHELSPANHNSTALSDGGQHDTTCTQNAHTGSLFWSSHGNDTIPHVRLVTDTWSNDGDLCTSWVILAAAINTVMRLSSVNTYTSSGDLLVESCQKAWQQKPDMQLTPQHVLEALQIWNL